ncbi:MAG: PKD domain-containing protein, partial [Janthinobacterium lividum]
TGAVKPWAVNKVIKQYGSQAGVLALNTDGTTVYGSGFWYGGTQANFEGAWAVSPSDGAIKWLADCHGDNYDSTVSAGVLYVAAHPHDCSNIGGFPEQTPKRVEWRGAAFTTAVGGDVQPNSLLPDKFKSYTGYKAPSLVNWFPAFSIPTCAKPANDCSERNYATQPTQTIESSGDYVVVGGQFPTVNGTAQQGLVRFGRSSVAPDKSGPRVYYSDPGNSSSSLGAPTVRAVASNRVRVTAAPWDRDSSVLSSVQLWRSDKAAPVYSATDVTSLWWKTSVAYTDTDVSPGQTYSYYLKLTDQDGNTTTTSKVSATTPSSPTVADSTYSKQVLSDGASGYWRLDDAAVAQTTGSNPYPTGALDYAGSQDLTVGPGVTSSSSGAIGSDGSVSTNGGANAALATATPAPAPQTFSAEAWFKSSSTVGGQVIGYGNTATILKSGATVFDKSYIHDRQVYLTPGGQLVFYLNPGSAKSIQTPKAYNDGKWHQVVASLSSSGMALYVDGSKVASWSAVTSGQAYNGYWRIAGDNPSGVPGAGSGSGNLTGAVDDVSVYPTALSASQVADHYRDATGSSPASVPNVAFTTDCTGLACAYDASSSTPEAATDAAPTIESYAWSFGDGVKASGAKSKHTYKRAASYDVALTVTNSDGMDATVVQSLAAKGNAVPVAAFTSKVKKKKVSFDAKKSSDSDGTVTKFRWTFGDGASSTKKKVSHSYVGTGLYPVSLTVTDDEGATSSSTKVVQVGSALAADTFTRTTDGGWGTANRGGAWSTSPADAFAVTGGRGELTLAGAGSAATAQLAKVSSKKANVAAEVTADKVATGKGTVSAFLLRKRSSDTYRAELVLGSGGTVNLVATRVVDGKEKTLKTVEVTKLTYEAGQTLRVRATISSAKKAKIAMTVWKSGTKEPKAQLSKTDSTKALRKSGAVGVWGSEASSATNAPVVLGYDNLLVTSS